ncbi:ABC transporter ATP-binding protein [Streptomyces uncialis]|uniref:ABC transporter ATP-binding protein n=1 Tax=Streptomyces uncialis TaxID=1048205 RepID=UPI00366676B8
MTEPMIRITDLELHSSHGPILNRVSLTVAPQECVAVVGASGSGKTTLALAVLGHLRPGITHRGGQVRVAGHNSLPQPPPGLRGQIAGYVGQDAGTTLNPYQQLRTTVRTALGTNDGPAADSLLRRVGLPPALGQRRPAELSGGQQQRGALAVALARTPQLLVLDEPTSALDPAARDTVRAELGRLRTSGVGLLWITHDLSSLDGLADRIVVLHDGRIVEDGPAARVTSAPRSPAAKRLHAATRSQPNRPRPTDEPPVPVLQATGLRAALGSRHVLGGLDLELHPRRCLAVTGVSGSGKSTLARCLAGLHAPDAGTILLDGRPLNPHARKRPTADRAAIQLIPQSPAETLHPAQSLHTALSRPLRVLRGMKDPTQIDKEITRLLSLVQLSADHTQRLPGELSGGQRQRAAIARALAAQPRVLLCDEMTSALDSVTQASVLELLRGLCEQESLGILVITHDPHVVNKIADEVTVLREGTLNRPDTTHENNPPAADDPARPDQRPGHGT